MWAVNQSKPASHLGEPCLIAQSTKTPKPKPKDAAKAAGIALAKNAALFAANQGINAVLAANEIEADVDIGNIVSGVASLFSKKASAVQDWPAPHDLPWLAEQQGLTEEDMEKEEDGTPKKARPPPLLVNIAPGMDPLLMTAIIATADSLAHQLAVGKDRDQNFVAKVAKGAKLAYGYDVDEYEAGTLEWLPNPKVKPVQSMQFVLSKPAPSGVKFGVTFYKVGRALLIEAFTDPSGIMATSGIAVGDTVLSINDVKPVDAQHAVKLLTSAPAGNLVFQVSRPIAPEEEAIQSV